ncbi:rCG56260 [Rattus norvegicus]|uniref:RCG56260 n=1 Tax=Rattus norvegicus TaxID=10116 RepID=A6IAU7_RAT|nr:rCG56260 [Rattus norvegicus]
MFCHFQDVEDLNPAYSPFVFGGTRGWNGFWNHPLIPKMGVQVDSGQEGVWD